MARGSDAAARNHVQHRSPHPALQSHTGGPEAQVGGVQACVWPVSAFEETMMKSVASCPDEKCRFMSRWSILKVHKLRGMLHVCLITIT